MSWTIAKLLQHGVDPWLINENGESAVYCSCKSGSGFEMYKVLQRADASVLDTTSSGPNRWSPLRRSLYSQDTRIFHEICYRIQKQPEFDALINEISPDGLSLLHECAFLPGEAGVIHARTLKVALRNQRAEILEKRLSARGQRPALTPFQLAVICHNFELAKVLVQWGCNPLRGVNRSRFLGFIISYQVQDSYEPSTFLNEIVNDPVVNHIRRFPHPATMRSSITYLLENEGAWWINYNDFFRGRWKNSEIDEDANHDPFLSWQPGLEDIFSTLARRPDEPRDAIARYGYGGLFDANDLGFGIRARHIRDYRSFIVAYRYDSVTEQRYGHKFVTALEAAFDGVMGSPYPTQAEQVLYLILEHFHGRHFCNFPYFQYLPTPFWQRTMQTYLRRRETVLHRAVRNHKAAIVKRLLEAGADWDMANINWQTPLRLAQLLEFGLDPDARDSHASFLSRFTPSRPVQKTAVSPRTSETTRCLALLEDAAITSSGGPWSFIRALKEVRWPWDDYETDDMGVRFLLFYAISLSLLILPILILAGLITMWRPILDDHNTMRETLSSFHDLGNQLGHCVLNNSAKCEMRSSISAPALADAYASALSNFSHAVSDTFEDCYRNMKGKDHDARLVACGFRVFVNNYNSWMSGNYTVMDSTERALAEKICHCKCSLWGTPFTRK